jgi:uncharacterized protein (DUF433 family)
MATRKERAATTIDRRERPAYTLAEAARYVKLPVATLRSWVVGRHYPTAAGRERFHPLIKPAQVKPPVLSFWNLVEAHVLRSLRTEHGVAIRELRSALTFAERTLGLRRLLLNKALRTQAGELFLERYGELIHLSASGQLMMRRVLEEHLRRVEWDDSAFPIRLYPFVTTTSVSIDSIAIDPGIAFGRPVLRRTSISTAVIADRIDAGESVAALAGDYGLSEDEIEQAVLYERAA